MILFGAGYLICTPTHDGAGNAIATPTPVRLGALQDISVDLGSDIKTLYGQGQFPIAAGRGKAKTDIKAKNADINGAVLGSLHYGKTAAATKRGAVVDSASVVPATGPYTVTAAPPGGGTWVADLGVMDTATGQAFTRVSSAPTAGQYTVAAGVYTFAAGDASRAFYYSYEYSVASGGQTFALTNDPMGYMPQFSLILQQSYGGSNLVLKLNRVVSSKLNFPFKNEDFAVSDFECTAFTDAAGNLGWISLW